MIYLVGIETDTWVQPKSEVQIMESTQIHHPNAWEVHVRVEFA